MKSNFAASEFEKSSIAPFYFTATEGAVAEGLFFYPVINLTLMKDETVRIPFFTDEMSYKHIYTWKIDDFFFRQKSVTSLNCRIVKMLRKFGIHSV